MDALERMRAEALEKAEDSVAQWDESSAWESGGGKSSHLRPQLLYGFAFSMNTQGHEMQDFHVAEILKGNYGDGGQDDRAAEEEVGLFAVFDSHGGPGGTKVGSVLQQLLFHNILTQGGLRADPLGAVRDGYLQTDRAVLESLPANGISTGSGGSSVVTAIVLENGRRLVVANVGDAKGVLCRNGQAEQLTVDHDLTQPLERAAVERRGGIVVTLPWDGVPRVNAQLTVARAFGDRCLKQHMTAKPDVADVLLDLSCEFLILASNELWRMVGVQEAVDMVKRIADPVEAARSLVLQARERLSDEDVACVVIRFRDR